MIGDFGVCLGEVCGVVCGDGVGEDVCVFVVDIGVDDDVGEERDEVKWTMLFRVRRVDVERGVGEIGCVCC